ncbi:hypothetical protein KZ829_36675 [Actinoplanes hulinensis]|uniref:T3SS peptide-binding chaperone domain-containing protein n=1 Tax=Actinoplanes hulinensis TaxID=1144547 RepID=A0ABS7BEG6_9ACTN|nr:hypothetical protein [Actinoplanes hulinensis]MBW6439262.1 hypothetical protein [Actinoplanes hulinensis]MBW6439273.1 hypothetical protein [Actinoplanes hulinensis]
MNVGDDRFEMTEAHRYALAWRLLSAVARRHPDRLVVREGEGSASPPQAIGIADADAPSRVYVNVDVGASQIMIAEVTWPLHQMLAGPLAKFSRDVETEAGLAGPDRTPAATPRTLTYRAAAVVAAMTVHNRKTISPRDVRHHLGLLAHFPQVWERDRTVDPQRPEPGRFWLLRTYDDRELAVLDTEGYAYVGESIFHLPTVYAQHGRNLRRTVAAIFARLL